MRDLSTDAKMPRRQKALALCLVFVAAFAAYAGALDSYFLSDDFAQVGRVLVGDLSVTWGHEHGGFFRPLFVLSLWADAKLWGRAPLGYHLTNVALHALNSFLVLLLSLRLAARVPRLGETAPVVSLAAALVFLLHPSHTEAVTWISGRADLLATLFCLAALLLRLSHAETARPARLVLSLLSFAAALLSKESAACLPLLVGLTTGFAARHDGVGRARALVRGVRDALPFLLLLVVYVAVRAAALGTFLGGYGAGQHLNFSHSMIVSQLLRFPLRALLPANALRALPFLESRALSPTLIVVGCAAVVALAFTLARAGGRRRLLAFARRNAFLWALAALFLAALLPAINLRIEVYSTQGERFLYLPSVFSSIALSCVVLGHARGALARRVLLCALLVLYAAGLWAANRHWAEAARLSRQILQQVVRLSTRENVFILNLPDNYAGAYLFRNGMPEALQIFQDEKQFKRADILAWHNLPSPPDGARLAEEAGVYTLTLPHAATRFERFNDAPPYVEILERGEKILRFRLRDAGAADLLFYGPGEMLRGDGGDVVGEAPLGAWDSSANASGGGRDAGECARF